MLGTTTVVVGLIIAATAPCTAAVLQGCRPKQLVRCTRCIPACDTSQQRVSEVIMYVGGSVCGLTCSKTVLPRVASTSPCW